MFGIFKRKHKYAPAQSRGSAKLFVEAIKEFEHRSDIRARKKARAVIVKRKMIRGGK